MQNGSGPDEWKNICFVAPGRNGHESNDRSGPDRLRRENLEVAKPQEFSAILNHNFTHESRVFQMKPRSRPDGRGDESER